MIKYEKSPLNLQQTLVFLDVSACHVVDPSPLGSLRALRTLALAQNRVEHIEVSSAEHDGLC